MKRIFQTIIRFYQRFLSPLTLPSCRFQPTCSQYTYEALEKRGVIKGLLLGVFRIVRCNPFYKGPFYDPVPNAQGEKPD